MVKLELKLLSSLVNLTRDRNRLLTVEEVMEAIGCCKSHAYNYLRALDRFLSSMIA
jgi:predicted DNA-binding transcriptional regulator AlpA